MKIETERLLTPYVEQFETIVNIIESAKERAYRKVNEELILMYRDIGEYISKQSENTEYGDAFVQKLADFFAENYPDLRGFNHRGLYRMKQFYELYKDNEKVSPLVTQLSWTNHLKIMYLIFWTYQTLYQNVICRSQLYEILKVLFLKSVRILLSSEKNIAYKLESTIIILICCFITEDSLVLWHLN